MWRRTDFPVLARRIGDKAVNYLDSAATALRPRAVIDAVVAFESTSGANVHRGGHALGDEASELFERARADVGTRFSVPTSDVVFTGSTTLALNIVAMGLPIATGGNIVTTSQEHHAALLPYYTRCEVRFVDVGLDGAVDPQQVLDRVDSKTAAVVLSQASNVTGRRHAHAPLLATLRQRGVATVVDGAQGAAHGTTDLEALGCDYYAFSGHKLLAPSGVGVLTGKREALERLGQPLRGGGTVRRVSRTEVVPRILPHKLEPGTPPIAAAIGLGAALRYVDSYDAKAIEVHEAALSARLVSRALAQDAFTLLGPSDPALRLPLVSLVARNPRLDVEALARQLSDGEGIMVRSGHLCCHPYFDTLGLSAALRVSAHAYNTLEEIDACFDALERLATRW